MSERKVLNKYYPPDFDPSKIPRMKLPKNRQYTVRLMAPFNMRCKTCGEYIYKGKKFNARKEDAENEDYLGIRIYRFYIKCTRCLQEISFKTDPRNTDYEIEEGATRNFMALKLAQEQEKREEDAEKEEEATNPMKLLENRTQQSKQEIELMESLEELRDLNRRQGNVDYDSMLLKYNPAELKEQIKRMQEEEDENTVKSLMGIKRKIDENEDEELVEDNNMTKSIIKNVITSTAQSSAKKKVSKLNLLNLVKVNNVTSTNNVSSTNNVTSINNIINTNKTKESCNSLSLIGNYSSSDDSN
ncbi:coiled-coil domain-containing protein 94 [Melanaphis sacchari]|uniref:coiled-coil domain-containing protein 94 n=1 Tax=Melanaphis sacchari TaxID=742174 RepID=UPI000DC146BA|nr:coiled-coil domain-containing protein 94 [Melanaphis sacchari]